MCKIFFLIPCHQRKLRQTKCLLFDFWMIKLTKTLILPNCQLPNGFFWGVIVIGTRKNILNIFRAIINDYLHTLISGSIIKYFLTLRDSFQSDQLWLLPWNHRFQPSLCQRPEKIHGYSRVNVYIRNFFIASGEIR